MTEKNPLEFTIPLGANEVTLRFTDDNLEDADFDDLISFITLFKKQFNRKTPSSTKDEEG